MRHNKPIVKTLWHNLEKRDDDKLVEKALANDPCRMVNDNTKRSTRRGNGYEHTNHQRCSIKAEKDIFMGNRSTRSYLY